QDDLYVLGTAYWRRSPERKAFGVLPVFWGSSSTNATSWTLLPLAHYSAKPDKRMLLTPLFFARRNGPNRSSAGVLPLLTFWGEQDETQWGIQVPLGGYAHNSATGEGSGAVPLLLTFWDYSKDHATVAQFPLFMRSTDQNSTFQMLTPLLFGYHWEHPDMGMMDVAGALPLYLSYEDDETEFKLVTAALYARWRDPTTRFTMVGPLFGHTRAGRSTWGLAPLFGVQHDRVADVRRLLALPGIYWSDGPEHLTLVAGPLWSAHNDAGMRSDGVLPLFMRHRWADGSRVLWLPGALDIVSREAPKEELNWRFTWLLNGLRYANRISGQVTTAVAPLFVESHNRHTGDHWALTLPWVYTDGNTLRDTRRIIAPPFFYKRDDDLLSWMVVPLLFRHRDSQSDTTLVLPLWLDHASEGERLQLGPVLFGRYRREGTPEQQMDLGWAGLYGWYATETSRLRLLAPVWMDWAEQRDGIARELQVVAPIYGRYTETGPDGVTESTTAVGPLFGYEGREGSGFGLFPLIWHDRLRRPEGDRGHDVVFPLVWRFFDASKGRDTTIVGPMYALERPGREDYGIAPLYAGGWRKRRDGRSEGYQTVLPLFWYDYGVDDASGNAEALLLTPVGYNAWFGEEVSGLWGPYYFDRTATSMTDLLFPLVYRHRDEQGKTVGVAPLYWSREAPEGSLRVVAPFYAHSEDRIADRSWTWAFPYVGWQDGPEEMDVVLPLYLSHRNQATGSRTRTLFPLWLDIENREEETRFQALGPVWHKETGEGYDTGIFPLVWWGAEQESRYTVGFPLLWRFVDGEDALTVVPPAWVRSWGEGGWSAGLFPLGFAQRDPIVETSRTMIGPVYHSNIRGDRTLVVPPLYMHHIEEGRRLHLGPLYGHGADEATDTRWSWVGPVFTHGSPDGRSTVVLPVYASRTEADGSGWQLAGPYYGRRSADGARLDTLGGLVWNWAGAPDSDGSPSSGGTVVGPIYHARDAEGTRRSGVAPLAHLRREENGDTEGWVLPVTYYKRSGDGSERTLVVGPMFNHMSEDRVDRGIAPLVWNYKTPQRSGHAVLPLYWYEGRPDGHTFVSPLGWSYREGPDYTNWALLYGSWGNGQVDHRVALPLMYSRRSQDGSAFDMITPLFARYRSPGARSGATVLFPLYWDFYNTDAQTRFRLVAPFFARSETAEEELTILPLWFMKRRKDGTRMSHGLVPLYYYSEDPIGYRFNLLGGLVGVDHNAKAEETDLQLMWIPF
ncbi:MAG: hypothetical protein AAFX99_13630, partial [Myxococcota bacterium]